MPEKNPSLPDHPFLSGAAPPGRYGFEDETGEPLVGGEGIIPILEQIEDRRYKFIGTGFFITSTGLFATAKHVLRTALENEHPIFTWQLIPPNQWTIRPVLQYRCHDIADLAIGLAAQVVHTDTKELLEDTRLRLTKRLHSAGDLVVTYAYPNTIIQTNDQGHVFSFQPDFYEGQILEYLSSGRDSVMLPGPCYHTNIVVHYGASGGPVAGPFGRVFGVNSTGFDGTSDSYISRIDELLSLEINLDQSHRETITVQQLAEQGIVTIDP